MHNYQLDNEKLSPEDLEEMKKLAEKAMAVQNACNLSGVVSAFAGIMSTLNDIAYRLGEGTDWKNHHPVCVLFTNKMSDLSGSAFEEYSRAYRWAQEMEDLKLTVAGE